jgi:hypothetical protein
MPKEWTEADDSVGTIAGGLLPNYHAELVSARIKYVFVSEASKKGGHDLYGRVKRVSGFLEWAIECDFLIEVALDKWNELETHQRTALVDHLLERCTGEEDEKTGNMRWKLREPDVQEFSSILDRHGAWHNSLAGFVSVAKRVNLDGFEEEEEENLNLVEEQVQQGEGSADISDEV